MDLATVIAPSEGQLTDALRNAGASVVVAPYDWWCHPAGQPPDDMDAQMVSSMRSIWQQVALLRSIDPDLVWTQSLVLPWGALLALLLQKPHIWSVCEYGEKDYRLQFYLPFTEVLRLVDLTSDFVFASSAALRRDLFPILTDDRADVLHCNIDVAPPERLEQADVLWEPIEAIRIAILGSILFGKGQEDVIRALGLLKARGRRVQLLIAGYADKGYLAQLHSLIGELGVADSVIFTGFIPNPYPTMATADIVVSCSRSEAFGRTVVEAMLLERSIVYTSAGGYLDYMIDGTTGLAYPPGDFEKLAEHIEALIEDPILRKTLGQFARAHAQKSFSSAGYGEKAHKRIIELSRQPPRLLGSLGPHASTLLGMLFDALQSSADLANQRREFERKLSDSIADLQEQKDKAVDFTTARRLELEADRAAQQQQNEALRHTLETTTAAHAALTNKIYAEREVLRTEHALTSASLRAVEAQRDLAERALQNLQQKQLQLREALSEQVAQGERFRATLMTQIQEIAGIYRSTSWRITAPLRRVMTLFRRVIGR